MFKLRLENILRIIGMSEVKQMPNSGLDKGCKFPGKWKFITKHNYNLLSMLQEHKLFRNNFLYCTVAFTLVFLIFVS